MRDSDTDAAIYYLAKMIDAGEQPAFIARRIMICAAEDVSNADPYALVVATNASLAVERLGMPEARITLSQAALYVACAPKSNAAYNAINSALSWVEHHKTEPIPSYLQDASYKGAKKFGHGIGYQYAHNFENHWVKQQYLPDGVADQVFYHGGDLGYEAIMKQWLKDLKKEG